MPASANDLTDAEFHRLYGAWAGRGPADVATLFADYGRPWWIAGGWAIEAFTGVRRAHEDCDPSILRTDLPRLRRLVRGRYDVWTATRGALRPVLDLTPAGEDLPEACGQVWLRPSWDQPWEYDVLLAPGDARTWVYRRDPSMTMPMREALWRKDGIPYLQPQIQLLYKAPGLRSKDQADFDATLPLLDARQRAWLAEALRRTRPGHPWLDRL
ncbi:hypothetical protein [Luteipulveratus flavus]|uniref:Amino acid transporter n=1 Tax=Luteipulveratus flavus TaxID=3031728 RepID=A0ABT6C9H1_9MICO|nr:hypothetical protein [Luteipulveratus sp. YIM 133296]MDF8265450.1 hypothetical protein [Luteipulveratus sp. YIM 133296]